MNSIKQICIYSLLLFSSLMIAQNKPIKIGIWRGVLELTNQKNELVLPFNFDVFNDKGKTIITIFNAEEKITVDEITVS